MTVEQIMEVLAFHRWKTMGVGSVECECGEILEGDELLLGFPADEAFRRHLAERILEREAGREFKERSHRHEPGMVCWCGHTEPPETPEEAT